MQFRWAGTPHRTLTSVQRELRFSTAGPGTGWLYGYESHGTKNDCAGETGSIYQTRTSPQQHHLISNRELFQMNHLN
jgi:hypothetical protein